MVPMTLSDPRIVLPPLEHGLPEFADACASASFEIADLHLRLASECVTSIATTGREMSADVQSFSVGQIGCRLHVAHAGRRGALAHDVD
jgi:hypothetical protein